MRYELDVTDGWTKRFLFGRGFDGDPPGGLNPTPQAGISLLLRASFAKFWRCLSQEARRIICGTGSYGHPSYADTLEDLNLSYRYKRQKLAEEFARGYLCGWKECFELCKTMMEGHWSDEQ